MEHVETLKDDLNYEPTLNFVKKCSIHQVACVNLHT